MSRKPRTLTGRIALHLGVTKASVRDAFLIAAVAIVLIVLLLAALMR